jgi:hypothetical protein
MKLLPYKWMFVGLGILLLGVVFTITQLVLPTTSTQPLSDDMPVRIDSTGGEATLEPILLGNFTDTPSHPGEGVVSVFQSDSNQIVRLSEFSSTAGPDLFVYLATDESATDFVNLGTLKSTQGNQNYDIPAGTDIKDYPYVLVWCERFGVLFMSALVNEPT